MLSRLCFTFFIVKQTYLQHYYLPTGCQFVYVSISSAYGDFAWQRLHNGKIATSGVLWLAVDFGLYFNYYYYQGFILINVISTYVYPEVLHLLQFVLTLYKVFTLLLSV